MEKFNATVRVKLKPSIKDIKALTLKKAISNLLEVQNLKCRVGNIYSLEFEAEDKIKAEEIVKTISDEILSNNVIEEYEITW